MTSYLLMNIDDLGAMVVSSVVSSLHLCFYFIKYFKEMPVQIRGLISSHEYL